MFSVRFVSLWAVAFLNSNPSHQFQFVLDPLARLIGDPAWFRAREPLLNVGFAFGDFGAVTFVFEAFVGEASVTVSTVSTFARSHYDG